MFTSRPTRFISDLLIAIICGILLAIVCLPLPARSGGPRASSSSGAVMTHR